MFKSVWMEPLQAHTHTHTDHSNDAQVMRWKLGRGKFRPLMSLLEGNSEEAVVECSRRAFEAKTPKTKVRLMNVHTVASYWCANTCKQAFGLVMCTRNHHKIDGSFMYICNHMYVCMFGLFMCSQIVQWTA